MSDLFLLDNNLLTQLWEWHLVGQTHRAVPVVCVAVLVGCGGCTKGVREASWEAWATLRYVCRAHVQLWGRQWGMCTQGHLIPICSRFYDHHEGHADWACGTLCVHVHHPFKLWANKCLAHLNPNYQYHAIITKSTIFGSPYINKPMCFPLLFYFYFF